MSPLARQSSYVATDTESLKAQVCVAKKML